MVFCMLKYSRDMITKAHADAKLFSRVKQASVVDRATKKLQIGAL